MAGVTQITVRTGERSDWPFVEDVGARSAAASRGRPASDAALKAGYFRLLDFVAQQSHVLLVAEAQGRPVGFLILLDRIPDEVTLGPQGFIAYMAVEPEFQARGAGSALLRSAEDEARRLGLPYISLMVTEANAAARRLYERAGYQTERRLLCKAL